jgi:hypothetical protein
MPLLVRMHVYSGRPDSEWVISGPNELELRRLAANAPAGTSPDDVGKLGYRGFTVIETTGEKTGIEPLFTVQRTGAPRDPSDSITGVRELEYFLLWTGQERISDSLAAHIQEVLEGRSIAVPDNQNISGCLRCEAEDAPVYTPLFWNDRNRRPNNNCYNYANNQVTNTFAQPGRATGHAFAASIDCAGVRSAAQSDGLLVSSNFSSSLDAGAGWYVALVIWPGNDYHWYRQDDVGNDLGCWSHKPGRTSARNVDNAGRAITDPRTCNRGPYAVFCTYMITQSSVHVN